MNAQVATTIRYLLACRAARDAGMPVALTTDPAWLVNMAINRRAGWPDDPGFLRGSAMPVGGRYPARASDRVWTDARRLADAVNRPRLVVRINECPVRYRARLAHRLTGPVEIT